MTAAAVLEVPRQEAVPDGFAVTLPNFEGPFDLLLSLIARRQLDITEVALSLVTDEFLAYTKAHGADWDLDAASDFLVVAATLLDLKTARLLPSADVEDEEDLALLEARDLLFARLLQYRAYQQAGALLAARMAAEALWHPREVRLEDRYAKALPELVFAVGAAELAAVAARALAPRPAREVPVSHLHAPAVSVQEQAAVLVERLQGAGTATFRALTADCSSTTYVVARFLALLQLFHERVVSFEQVTPLGELTVRWSGEAVGEVDVGDEFDAGPAVGAR